MINRGREPIKRQTRGRNITQNVDAYPFEIKYTHLGQRLKDERKRLHYTQEEVAEVIGITPAFVGHIERGERSLSLETLIKFCNFYGITIDYLLADTLPPDNDIVTEQIRTMLKGKTAEQKTAILDIMRAIIRNI